MSGLDRLGPLRLLYAGKPEHARERRDLYMSIICDVTVLYDMLEFKKVQWQHVVLGARKHIQDLLSQAVGMLMLTMPEHFPNDKVALEYVNAEFVEMVKRYYDPRHKVCLFIMHDVYGTWP